MGMFTKTFFPFISYLTVGETSTVFIGAGASKMRAMCDVKSSLAIFLPYALAIKDVYSRSSYPYLASWGP